MDLTLHLHPPSHPPSCHVSLPTSVASSLASLPPLSSLHILQADRRGHAPLYLSWIGDVHPTSLALHPHFASHLGLRHGQVLRITIAERLSHANAASCRVDHVLLRPLHPRDTAIFASLTVSAPTLERVVLAQIRVLTPRLTFPLALPAGVVVFLTVQTIHSQPPNAPYAVLFPGAQLVVEPPPAPLSTSSLLLRLRLLSYSAALAQIPVSLLNACAFIHGDPQSKPRCAYVSPIPSRTDHVRVPVSVRFERTIPKKHVYLPSHVWTRLHLAPLSLVLLQEVATFPHGSVDVALQNAPVCDLYPSLRQLSEHAGVYYHGMRLRDAFVKIAPSPYKPPAAYHPDTWDGVIEGSEDKYALIDSNSVPTDVSMQHPKTPLPPTLPPFISFPEQRAVPIALPEGDDDGQQQIINNVLPIHHPMRDTHILRSASRVSQSGRDVIDSIVAFTTSKPPTTSSSVLLLEAPSGCGKTFISQVATAILRLAPCLRTVWIRCRAHANEPLQSSILRIREAYREAFLTRPAIVVFDDVDAWLNERQAEEKAKKNRQTSIANELEQRTRLIGGEQVTTLLTCVQFRDMPYRLRAPSVVGKVLKLHTPSSSERAFLLWNALEKASPELTDEGLLQEERKALQRQINDIANVTEGFSVRAITALKPLSSKPTAEMLDDMLRRATKRRELMGWNKATSNVDMKRAWDSIGAAEHIKQVLNDVLQLQSSYSKFFGDIPIQMPKSVLLYGPPGCGKTMIAKVAAAYSGKSFIVVRGPELMSKYIGESEAEIRRAFEKAARQKPCVLLFDEFDSIAPRRGSGAGVTDRMVNSLLTCLDGAERLSDDVYILATSSRPEVIDPAVLRPGRIDIWLQLDIPKDAVERLKILKAVISTQTNQELQLTEEHVKRIADETEGYTGADLSAVVGDISFQMQKLRENVVANGNANFLEGAIDAALKNSRPSISVPLRRHYEETMKNFNPGRSRDAVSSPPPKEQRYTLR